MVTIKFLSSLNNVESWTSKALWDAALKNVRVVVSTPQVLLDAMTHGFVSIEDISLLVFDEGAVLFLCFFNKVTRLCSVLCTFKNFGSLLFADVKSS
jgi:hypothetical protein